MVIAGVVIETVPGEQAAVIGRLDGVPGLSIKGGDGVSRIAVVWSAADGRSLTDSVEALMKIEEGIVGVYPTFVGEDAD